MTDEIDKYEDHMRALGASLAAANPSARLQFIVAMLQRATETLSSSKVGYPEDVKSPLIDWCKRTIDAWTSGADPLAPGEHEVDALIEEFENNQGDQFTAALEHIVDLLSAAQPTTRTAPDPAKCRVVADAAIALATASEDVEDEPNENTLLAAELDVQHRLLNGLIQGGPKPPVEAVLIGR